MLFLHLKAVNARLHRLGRNAQVSHSSATSSLHGVSGTLGLMVLGEKNQTIMCCMVHVQCIYLYVAEGYTCIYMYTYMI